MKQVFVFVLLFSFSFSFSQNSRQASLSSQVAHAINQINDSRMSEENKIVGIQEIFNRFGPSIDQAVRNHKFEKENEPQTGGGLQPPTTTNTTGSTRPTGTTPGSTDSRDKTESGATTTGTVGSTSAVPNTTSGTMDNVRGSETTAGLLSAISLIERRMEGGLNAKKALAAMERGISRADYAFLTQVVNDRDQSAVYDLASRTKSRMSPVSSKCDFDNQKLQFTGKVAHRNGKIVYLVSPTGCEAGAIFNSRSQNCETLVSKDKVSCW